MNIKGRDYTMTGYEQMLLEKWRKARGAVSIYRGATNHKRLHPLAAKRVRKEHTTMRQVEAELRRVTR